MPSCWQEAISALWIGVLGRYRLSAGDKVMEAEEQLERLLEQLERREDVLHESLEKCRAEALLLRKDRGRCKAKVAEYKRTVTQLERLVSYKEMVMQQMDAIKNTELNKSLITTLQESSRTLKALGVLDGVKQAEAVVQDVETSMSQALELTSVLGAPMGGGVGSSGGTFDITEEDLDLELAGLMEEDSGLLSADTHNSMETTDAPQPEAAKPSSTAAAAATTSRRAAVAVL
jgi:hypothetical protein